MLLIRDDSVAVLVAFPDTGEPALLVYNQPPTVSPCSPQDSIFTITYRLPRPDGLNLFVKQDEDRYLVDGAPRMAFYQNRDYLTTGDPIINDWIESVEGWQVLAWYRAAPQVGSHVLFLRIPGLPGPDPAP